MYSEFANILRVLLDQTGTHSRSAWAFIIGSTQVEIEDWLTDKSFPDPKYIRSIWQCLLENTKVDDRLLLVFQEIAKKPLSEISPLGAGMKETLEEYIIRPVIEGCMGAFEILPPHSKVKAMYKLAEYCRELYKSDKTPPSLHELRGLGFSSINGKVEYKSSPTK